MNYIVLHFKVLISVCMLTWFALVFLTILSDKIPYIKAEKTLEVRNIIGQNFNEYLETLPPVPM